MPNTKFQRILFAFFMSFMMVFGMESYNHIVAATTFNINVLFIPLLELCWLMATVIVLETFIVGKIAKKMAFWLVNPQTSRPFTVILSIQICTVLLMCPLMSLVASIAFKNSINGKIWLETLAINFPMALFWQLLVAGPIVRFAVSKIRTGRYKKM